MAPRFPIQVVLYGKSPDMAKRAIEKLRPEYKVIEVFNSFEHVDSRLPPLLEPPPTSVSSESNDKTPNPEVVIIGGAFTTKEIESARELPNSNQVPWLQDNKFKPAEEWQSMTVEDLATDFVNRVKSCLREQ